MTRFYPGPYPHRKTLGMQMLSGPTPQTYFRCFRFRRYAEGSKTGTKKMSFVRIVMLAGCASLAFAQSNAIDAAIEGYVRDTSGGVIQGAHVTVRNQATNVPAEAST